MNVDPERAEADRVFEGAALLGIPGADSAIDWNTVIFNMLTLKGIYGREMYETWYMMPVMLFPDLVSPSDGSADRESLTIDTRRVCTDPVHRPAPFRSS